MSLLSLNSSNYVASLDASLAIFSSTLTAGSPTSTFLLENQTTIELIFDVGKSTGPL